MFVLVPSGFLSSAGDLFSRKRNERGYCGVDVRDKSLFVGLRDVTGPD